MSTWIRPYVGNDYEDPREYDFSEDGPYLCLSGGSEFGLACERYHYSKITDEVIERLIFMAENLERDKPYEEESLQEFRDWLEKNKGRRIKFRYE